MLCIIPARGGSTRLPKKNLLSLFGRPMIHYVIDTAEQSCLFDDIIVSTDSEEIAELVYGKAKVQMRPESLYGDVPEHRVLKYHALQYDADVICRIYPFAVLLTAERLEAGSEIIDMCDTVIEVQEYQHSPFRSMFFTNDSTEYMWPEMVDKRTQDLQTLYHDAATYMFCKTDALSVPLGDRHVIGEPVSPLECQDLDDAYDFELLELKFMRSMM